MPDAPKKVALSPKTAALVLAAHRLKSTDPEGWREFMLAYVGMLEDELRKLLDEPGDGYAVARAQGRSKFADTMAHTLDNCSELAKTVRDDLEQKRRIEAEQKRHKGTLLSP